MRIKAKVRRLTQSIAAPRENGWEVPIYRGRETTQKERQFLSISQKETKKTKKIRGICRSAYSLFISSGAFIPLAF
jgi:hypothetical protein